MDERHLEAVRVAAAELRRAEAFFQAAAARHRDAILAAHRAGVGRKRIARAAEITRQRVSHIVRTDTGE